MAFLAPGDSAPHFELMDGEGRSHRLTDYLGKGPLVVYFYPKDETAGCTAQACHFRDEYERFSECGAQVIGISEDGAQSHQKFQERHRLPFLLLSDPGSRVAQSFGLGKTLGFIKDRVTFVLSTEGTIELSFSSMWNMRAHVDAALTVVRRLSGPGLAHAK